MGFRVVVSLVHATWLANLKGRKGAPPPPPPPVWGGWLWNTRQGIPISTTLLPVEMSCGAAGVGEQI